MRLNGTDFYVSIVLKSLDETIAPELQSSSAQLALGVIRNCLLEILRREQRTPELIAQANARGAALLRELQLLRADADADTDTDAEAGVDGANVSPAGAARATPSEGGCANVAALIDSNAMITAALAAAVRAVSTASAPRDAQTNTLLRRAAQWEADFHRDLLWQGPLPGADRTPFTPVTIPALEDYLHSVHPQGSAVSVKNLRRAEGGSGKQTYFFTLVEPAGAKQELVIRKNYRSPLVMHGAFCIDNEFYLLSSVARLDLPVAQPLWLGQNAPGFDGDFYIMTRRPGQPIGTFLGGAEKISEATLFGLAALLAKLHSVPLERYSDYIARYSPASIYAETIEQCYRRQITEWRDYATRTDLLQSPFIEFLLGWLAANVPANSRRPVLLHGDFNIHNMLVLDGAVSGILDWEGAMFGAAEQDLAFIRPHIAKHIEWERFVGHYLQSGGQPLDRAAMDYYMGFSAMRVMLGLSRGQLNLQRYDTDDIRLCMLELGYIPEFMRLALEGCDRWKK